MAKKKDFNIENFNFDKADKTVFKSIKILSFVFIICLVLGVSLISGLYAYVNAPANLSDETPKTFVVNSGESVNSVLDRLESEGIIRSAFLAKLYLKVYPIETFYAGEYTLYSYYDFNSIVGELSGISNAKQDVISVKFVEGKRLTYYAKVISENFDYSEDEVMSVLQDKEYHQQLVKKYWFINDDILNDKLYYPLEGYLFPDTYEFNKNATIKDIINTMIKQMGSVLEPYKDEINSSPYGVHGLLTMASMVELEAVNAESRATVAGIFYNRLAKGWSLGSDVTTYYDVKKDIVPGTLTMSDLNGCNGYNTRSGSCVSGLPVGPIASVSKISLKAAIEPVETNYMYFVADSETNMYYAETQAGHDANISYLKSIGKWLE